MTTAARRTDRPTNILRELRDAADQAFRGGTRDRLDRAGFLFLLATVLLTAAPAIGAGPPLQDHAGFLGPGAGPRLVELFAFLTAAITLLSRSNARSQPPRAAVAAFAGIVLLGALQLLPLPENLLQSLAPSNAAVYHAARETLGAFGEPAPRPRISLAPTETRDALLLFLSCGALWLAAARLLHDRGRRRIFGLALVLAAAAGAAPAIFPTILPRVAERVDVAAARLELGLAVAFAVVWAEILTGTSRMLRSLDPSERLERRILPLAFRLVLWLTLVGSVAFTGSAAGTAAAGLTGVLLPFAAMRHPRAGARGFAAAGLALAAAAISAGIYLAAAPAARPPSEAAAVRAAAWEAWKAFPVFGSGLGAFAEGFARTQPPTVPGRVTESGCDALDALVTSGALGTALAALLATAALVLLARKFRRQKHREESAYALGGIGALFSLLIHGVGASVLAATPVALGLAAVLGAAWAAGATTSRALGD